MKKQLSVVLILLFFAGCSGLSGDLSPESDSAAGEQWKYRIVIENDYEATKDFTVTLTTESGRIALNESQQLHPGERWVAVTLTEAEHGNHEYDLKITPSGEGYTSSKLYTTEEEGEGYSSGASLYRFSNSGSETHVCGGNVTCYK
ncbi:hypothetical protein [Haloarchaeobius sp. DYHT-AS-18]|uniref:hypothetical protein n=1 Tax=Haloarchaeobius sp. DYHT-AS-18 TaxID=3446117 RepID=UPI003EBBFB97